MATVIDLNDSIPAAPVGRKNVKWQGDSLDPRHVSAYTDDGGVNAQSGTSYRIVEGDNRKLVYFDNASAVAVAIDPSADLGATFFCWLENLGAGTVTLTPDGSETIDGAASLTLAQNQGVMLFSDGSNLFTSRGRGATGSFSAGGDLSGTSSSQTVIGLQGVELDAATVGSPSDGDVITYDDASGKYKAAAGGGGGGGGLTLLEQHTATSGDADMQFNSSISSAYDQYQVEILGFTPVTSRDALWFQYSTDGGSTWITTNIYRYASHAKAGTGADNNQSSNGTSHILLAITVASQANGRLLLYDPGSTTVCKYILSQMSYWADDIQGYMWEGGGGFLLSTSAVNAFRLLFSTGNISAGTARCYGIAKT